MSLPTETTPQEYVEEVNTALEAEINPPEQFNRLYPFLHAPQGFIINKNDQYIKPCVEEVGEFSEGEVDIFKAIVGPKDVVVEVGANFGTHTLALAELAGGVYAFEPQRLVYQVLCGNIALNNFPNVMALQMAVGAEPGHIVVPTLDPTKGNNFWGLSFVKPWGNGETVLKITLDSMNLKQLDFLKLDCEGMEPDVLEGAKETIKRCRPWIYAEFTSNRQKLLEMLRDMEYLVLRHTPMHARVPNAKGVTELSSAVLFASDMILAFPKYRAPKDSMLPPFGMTNKLFEPSTEEVLGKSCSIHIWEPYTRTDTTSPGTSS